MPPIAWRSGSRRKRGGRRPGGEKETVSDWRKRRPNVESATLLSSTSYETAARCDKFARDFGEGEYASENEASSVSSGFAKSARSSRFFQNRRNWVCRDCRERFKYLLEHKSVACRAACVAVLHVASGQLTRAGVRRDPSHKASVSNHGAGKLPRHSRRAHFPSSNRRKLRRTLRSLI